MGLISHNAQYGPILFLYCEQYDGMTFPNNIARFIDQEKWQAANFHWRPLRSEDTYISKMKKKN